MRNQGNDTESPPGERQCDRNTPVCDITLVVTGLTCHPYPAGETLPVPIRFLLHQRLREQNLPLTWLATEMNLSVAALRRLKNERAQSIRFEVLAALCEALMCEPGELFDYVESPSTRRDWRRRRQLRNLAGKVQQSLPDGDNRVPQGHLS